MECWVDRVRETRDCQWRCFYSMKSSTCWLFIVIWNVRSDLCSVVLIRTSSERDGFVHQSGHCFACSFIHSDEMTIEQRRMIKMTGRSLQYRIEMFIQVRLTRKFFLRLSLSWEISAIGEEEKRREKEAEQGQGYSSFYPFLSFISRYDMTMNALPKDRTEILNLINEWNSTRLDLFKISEPNEVIATRFFSRWTMKTLIRFRFWNSMVWWDSTSKMLKTKWQRNVFECLAQQRHSMLSEC